MDKKEIDTIKEKENIREDYGDLTELSASIRAHGVRNPIVINTNNEIIDGHRRLKAAKAAGLTEIPYVYVDNNVDEKTDQMLSGIFQKNLNPIEEGKAFKNYMESEQISALELSCRISKKLNYVEKRLELEKLPIKVQNALIKKKIQIGHALLLAKLPGEERLKFMKEIVNDDMGVNQAKDEMHYASSDLKEAPFCKGDCKNCVHNGSKQAELFETGTILSGECMNKKCFLKKMAAYIKQKKEEYKGIFFERTHEYNSNEDPSGYESATNTWNLKELGITEAYMKKSRKTRENYMVRFDSRGKMYEYFKIPKKKSDDGKVEPTEVQADKKEQGLLAKVSDFKTKFLIDKTKEKVESSNMNTIALGVLRLIQGADWQERDVVAEEMPKLIGQYGSNANVKNIFKATGEELDKVVSILAKNALVRVDLKELIEISRNFEIDVKKDFEITEDYLKMYTKDQLKNLMTEFEINSPKIELKKSELIDYILSQNLKGKVPTIML